MQLFIFRYYVTEGSWFPHIRKSEAGCGGISVYIGLVFRKLLRNFVSGGIKLINSRTVWKIISVLTGL